MVVGETVTGAGALNDGDIGSTVITLGVEFNIDDCSSSENDVNEAVGLLKRD